MVWLIIVGAAVVLMLVALPFADRRQVRKGHRPYRVGEIKAANRERRRDLSNARSARYTDRLPPQ